MKKVLFIYVFAALLLYGSFYSKVRAESHEKRETPQFIFPVACSYGEDCWAVNYVDVDPSSEERADFMCNQKTYEGHKGTDFALKSVADMRAGVDVFAAAPGRVLRVRDQENDVLKTKEEQKKIEEAQKQCGNGVLIDHGNGLQTIYCHLKQNSIVVKPKQKVNAGAKIGQVGQSGLAEFPHLHFGVIWEGGVVDPYTGMLNSDGCGQKKESLWHLGLPIKYDPVAIFNGGFRATVPDFDAMHRGHDTVPDTLYLSSAVFVFWAGFYNVEKGDQVTLLVIDPDGKVFTNSQQTVPKIMTRQYYYTGRKIGKVQLKTGTYKGVARITRVQENGDNIMREKTFSIVVK